MKKKLLVIFFIAVFFSIILYNLFYKRNNNILLLGEYNNKLASLYNLNTYTFYYDKTTYKELEKSIRNNDYIIVKNKVVYLNQLINKSNKIFIYISNQKDCNYLIKDMNNLKRIIKRISNAKVIFVDNKCNF